MEEAALAHPQVVEVGGVVAARAGHQEDLPVVRQAARLLAHPLSLLQVPRQIRLPARLPAQVAHPAQADRGFPLLQLKIMGFHK